MVEEMHFKTKRDLIPFKAFGDLGRLAE